jgi:hypothetical protein
MSEPGVVLELDHRGFCEPGGVLAGTYRLVGCEGHAVKSLTLEVFWQAEGKGGKDRESYCKQTLEPSNSGRFSARLPHGPFSYDGFLVKIVWGVSVTAKVADWKDLVALLRFQLGHVTSPNNPAAGSSLHRIGTD